MNVLQSTQVLENYILLAVDGEIGSIEGFYIDYSTWTVRYLVVNSANLLIDKYVLISTVAIGNIDEQHKTIDIELTRKQIENSPLINLDRALSRQLEAEYYEFFNLAPYWELDPSSSFPVAEKSNVLPLTPEKNGFADITETPLRTITEIEGFSTAAMDGKIGYVDEFIIDTQYWVIRYLEINSHSWWPSNHVLINPGWIEKISWTEQTVSVALTCEAMKDAPVYEPSKLISRDHEVQLFKHYGRPVYWRQSSGSD